MSDPRIGTRLGKYTVNELLGEGGMGSVYLGFDEQLERNVALKLLKPFVASVPEIQQRFRKEAIAMARLAHPNIVQIYAFDQDGENVFFVMEHVDGQSLSDLICERGSIPRREAITIIKAAAEGFGYAHANGVLHRDVKSSNIMVTASGKVKILDFGLAAIASEATMITMQGQILGTPNYISPEQARGEQADNRSDIYSLGIVLYHALAGVCPFGGESTLAILNQHITNSLPPLQFPDGGTDFATERVIWKMTAKEPGDRYQNTSELIEALDQLLHPDTSQDLMATQRITPPPGARKEPVPERLLRPAAKPPPKPKPKPVQTPDIIYERAVKSFKDGMQSRAMKYLDEMETMGATNYDYWKLRGQIQLKRGRVDQAITAFDQAISFAECEPELANNLGVMYQEIGDDNEAEAIFELALRLEPHFNKARLNLINMLLAQKRYREAHQHCTLFLQYEPRHRQVRSLQQKLRGLL